MPDATDIQSAIEEAISGGDNADSQTVEDQTPEVTDVDLDNKSTSDGNDTKDAKSTDKNDVPYDRFSQVVRQKNEISERFKNLEDQFKTASDREKELRSRIGDLEQDHQILEAIKDLAQDEKYRDHVVAIDRALQGLDKEIEQAQDTGDKKAESEALRKFEKKAAELENLVADQNAEMLWNETAAMAQKMLNSLPEEWTDEDISRLDALWNSRIDWSKIEKGGKEVIPEVLKTSFVETIKKYGTPQGALISKVTKEVESKIPGSQLKSNEEVVEGLLKKNWVEKDKEGKIAVSDDEFAAGMAEVLKRIHRA